MFVSLNYIYMNLKECCFKLYYVFYNYLALTSIYSVTFSDFSYFPIKVPNKIKINFSNISLLYCIHHTRNEIGFDYVYC